MTRRNLLFLLAGVLALLVISPQPARAAEAVQQYQVAANIQINGADFASPTLVVQANKRATMRVRGEDGHTLYTLQVTAHPLPDNNRPVDAGLDLGFSSQAGSVNTSVLVTLGQPLTLATGKLHITLTVTRPGR